MRETPKFFCPTLEIRNRRVRAKKRKKRGKEKGRENEKLQRNRKKV
jgi:hypothetical protein